MRPGVANQYLKEVIDGFDAYARRSYVPTLCSVEADIDHQVAGARFVATRDVDGMEGCLRELLEGADDRARRHQPTRPELDDACADAIVRTGADAASASRLLARVATDRRTARRSVNMLERRLAAMGAIGVDALLRELAAGTHDRARNRRLVRLLIELTDVAPPERVSKWIDLSWEERRPVIDAWRTRLREAGKLEGVADDADEAAGETGPVTEDT